MATVETAFAIVVTLLAGAAVILALVVAVYWLLVQIRRLRTQLHQPELWRRELWWRQRGATAPTIPERRP